MVKECFLHENYIKCLVGNQEEIKMVKSRDIGGHGIGSSLPILSCRGVCETPFGLLKVPDGSTAENLLRVVVFYFFSCVRC